MLKISVYNIVMLVPRLAGGCLVLWSCRVGCEFIVEKLLSKLLVNPHKKNGARSRILIWLRYWVRKSPVKIFK